jgi:hypothetical protein
MSLRTILYGLGAIAILSTGCAVSEMPSAQITECSLPIIEVNASLDSILMPMDPTEADASVFLYLSRINDAKSNEYVMAIPFADYYNIVKAAALPARPQGRISMYGMCQGIYSNNYIPLIRPMLIEFTDFDIICHIGPDSNYSCVKLRDPDRIKASLQGFL